MRLLDRLVIGSFFRLFLAFVLGAPLLFILGDVTERLDDYLDRGVPGLDVALAYVYQLPNFILWSFPIAGLVAAVFTVHSMTTHREIVAAKAGGISFRRLTAPLLVMGVLLTGVALGLSELVPSTNRIAAELLLERSGRREWRAYFVYQGEDGRSVSVRRLSVNDSSMVGVVMQTEPEGDVPALHVIADQATFQGERGWTFHSGFLRQLSEAVPERSFQFQEMRARGFDERPDELLEEPREADEMTYAELRRLAGVVQRSGGDPAELLTDMEQKRAIPVATLVIILFGAPLATTSKRGGAAFGIGLSLGSTILFILLLRISGSLGATGNLPPVLAAWLPNVVFLAAGVVLLARVRT